MGLFNFKSNKKRVEIEPVNNVDSGENQKFNLLQSIKTDSMDLSQPFIADSFNSGLKYVEFGKSNLYPQILNQLYLSSTMHAACVNFKTWSLIGDGYEWEGYDDLKAIDKIRIKTFERNNDLRLSSKKLTRDYIKHGRAIVLLHFNGEIYDKFKVVDPSEIRNNRGTLFTDVNRYFYSPDWIYRANLKELKPYKAGCKDEWQIFELKNDVGSSRSYGLPDWVSSANWASVGADLGLLHKSALQNGIQPSVLFKYPYLMGDAEEANWTRNMQQNGKGVENYNKGMKIEANGKENMPEIDILQTTDNHQLFEQTSKEYKEEVAISHNINPALMGIRVAGSLGANEEIEFSAKQFEKLWLNENRTTIEDFINDICRILNVNEEFIINKTDVITLVEAIEENNGQQFDNDGVEIEATIVNDNLKGLSAKENSDMYRIVRDYNKGRLNKTIAIARLTSYGIDLPTAEKILTTK